MSEWLANHPEITSVRTAICDLNGQARGKRQPIKFAQKLDQGGARMPLSVLNVDIRGEDIVDSPLVFASGDADGVLNPTERGYLPIPWLKTPAALLPMSMYLENGDPFRGDPRHALSDIVARYAKKGWRVVVATELEFYLTESSGPRLQAPVSPRSGKRRDATDILSLSALDAFDDFFSELYAACDAMDIPADSASSEGGKGQFEINLMHTDDALKAADDAWLFKLLVKGLAKKHGFAASFMAKPYDDDAGTGMHVHFSVIDAKGNNVFNDGGTKGTDLLCNAVAGCLSAMSGSTLIFAPHANSYARFTAGSHAPNGLAWGYENRTTAIRIPAGDPAARRIEHRVAGGDVNPYLILSAILGAAMLGIEDDMQAPDPIAGNAYSADLTRLPETWSDALTAFQNDPLLPRIFNKTLIENFVMTKTQELSYFEDLESSEQVDLYFDTV